MAKQSLPCTLFEWILKLIYPHKETARLKRLRRKIYYPVINDWGNYGYCRTNGGELEDVKVRMTGYIYWQVGGYVRWAYIASGLAPWICKRYSHKLVDCSSAGPESGNMDHECKRCGEYWHRTLY